MEAIEPPRLPLTAYFRYQNKYISEATKSTPYRLDPIKLARDASAHWHSMSVEEQQVSFSFVNQIVLIYKM